MNENKRYYTIHEKGTGHPIQVNCLSQMGPGDTVEMVGANGKKTLMFTGEHRNGCMFFSIGGGGSARFDPRTLRPTSDGHAEDSAYNNARANQGTPSGHVGKSYLGEPERW
ncbi:MAG: hypothetical protein KKE05_02395 [Nanoarchaeota archaeon]|nr:hypothetical protein [Nanoarchaeota archaeon]